MGSAVEHTEGQGFGKGTSNLLQVFLRVLCFGYGWIAWAQWSDREIAKQCAVSNNFVGDVRKSICHPMTDSAPVSAVKTVKRGDTVYQQNTTAIGRSAQPEPQPEPAPANDAPPWDDAPALIRT